MSVLLTPDGIATLALQAADLPPVSWGEWSQTQNPPTLMQVVGRLNSLASHYAMLARYLERRGGGAGGDQGHEDASRQANRRLVQVRRVLGYSYPQTGCFPF